MRRDKVKRLTKLSEAAVALAVGSWSLDVSAGTTTHAVWTGGGSVNNWNTTGNWSGGNQPDGSSSQPVIVEFAGTARLTPYNDYGNYIQYQQIIFNSSAGSFNLYGGSIKLYNWGATAKIENNNTSLQTVSFSDGNGQSLYLESNIELDPTAGDLTINNGILSDVGSETINVYGNSGHTLTLNGVYSNNGSNIGSLTIQDNNVVLLNASNTYGGDTTVNAGKLEFGSSGSADNSVIRLGNTSGSANAEIDLIALGGGQTIGSIINPRANSGTMLLNSQNTAGTNTLSNHIGLDNNFTISQATGGTLVLSSTHTTADTTSILGYDIKSYTANFNANGVINDTGNIYNSTGSGTVVMNGSGKLIFSGSNTYTGGTTLNSGTLVANTGGAGNSSTGTGTVTINSSGTLAGNGSTGAVVVNGGKITAGSGATNADSIGTLTTGSQNWSSGTFVAKVTTISSTLSSNVNDHLVMSGLTASGGFNFQLLATSGSMPAFTATNPSLTNNTTPVAGSYIVLADETHSNSGNPFSALVGTIVTALGVATHGSGDSIQLATQSDGGSGYLLMAEDTSSSSSAPEPTSFVLLGVVGTPLLLRRRRSAALSG